MLRAGELRQRAFEAIDFRPENEVARAQDAQESLVQLRFQRRVLRLQVEEIHRHPAIMREGRAAGKAVRIELKLDPLRKRDLLRTWLA